MNSIYVSEDRSFCVLSFDVKACYQGITIPKSLAAFFLGKGRGYLKIFVDSTSTSHSSLLGSARKVFRILVWF